MGQLPEALKRRGMTGEELRQLRLAAGMSQEELAGLCGVERRTIGRWEMCKQEIPTIACPGLRQILEKAIQAQALSGVAARTLIKPRRPHRH